MCGIRSNGHRQKDGQILINEKELIAVPGQDVAAKLQHIEGTMYSASDIKRILREEDWNE